VLRRAKNRTAFTARSVLQPDNNYGSVVDLFLSYTISKLLVYENEKGSCDPNHVHCRGICHAFEIIPSSVPRYDGAQNFKRSRDSDHAPSWWSLVG